MYCGKCGTQNQDGAMFCRECGASLNASSPVPAGADSGSLLYQSNGARNSIIVRDVILTLFFFVFGFMCFFLFLPNAKRNEIKEIITVGSIAFVVGFVFLITLIPVVMEVKRCWLKVYDDHVESYAGLMNNSFYCAYTQIQSVQMLKNGIVLTTGGTKHRIMCKEPQKAFDIINQCYMNALQARP